MRRIIAVTGRMGECNLCLSSPRFQRPLDSLRVSILLCPGPNMGPRCAARATPEGSRLVDTAASAMLESPVCRSESSGAHLGPIFQVRYQLPHPCDGRLRLITGGGILPSVGSVFCMSGASSVCCELVLSVRSLFCLSGACFVCVSFC